MRLLETIILILKASNPIHAHPMQWATWKQFWEAANPVKTYAVTVTATYVGHVEVEACSPEEAHEIVAEGLHDGTVSPDLCFSEYSGVDEIPEEVSEL